MRAQEKCLVKLTTIQEDLSIREPSKPMIAFDANSFQVTGLTLMTSQISGYGLTTSDILRNFLLL